MRRSRGAAVVLVAMVVVAACGSDGDGEATSTTVPSSTTTTAPGTSTSTTPTTTPSATTPGTSTPSTTTPGTTTSTTTSGSTTLPGEPIELFAQPGQVWSVVGVDRDDVLNVREAPGTDRAIVATLAPTADDVVTTGRARSLARSIWYEVEIDGGTGWVNLSFLALPGVVDDITAQVVADLGGIPTAETLVELGELVAATRASDDVESRIAVVVGPTLGDLGEITMDVLGFADDAVAGERLHVFADQDDSGEAFGLSSVEATTWCLRGLADGDRCT